MSIKEIVEHPLSDNESVYHKDVANLLSNNVNNDMNVNYSPTKYFLPSNFSSTLSKALNRSSAALL